MQVYTVFKRDCYNKVILNLLHLFAGYKGIYKKRTGNRVDGVGLFFKQSRFGLVAWSPVEYYIPGEPLLDRDNVGIVARLKFLTEGWKHWQIVVATTHLLFNTRRHDIKLAQTQLLLAECEAQAYRSQGIRYEISLF